MTERSYRTPGVYVEEVSSLPPGIAGVATAVPAFIGYTEFAAGGAYGKPVRIASPGEYAAQFGGAPPAGAPFNLATQIALFYANGGGACFVLSAGSYWEGQVPEIPAEPAADWQLAAPGAGPLLAALAAAEAAEAAAGIAMLVVPEACLLAVPDHARVIQAMLLQAGTLQDRLAILDLPGCLAATDYPALAQGRADLAAALAPVAQYASYGAAYAPALMLLDAATPPNASLTPPSGAMAGIWAQNDLVRGVWNSPANVSVAGVADLGYKMRDDEQGGFNTPADGVAVDVLRVFPGRGILVWGARTLDGNSNDWRYLAVRRTAIYIEQSIRLALQPFAFEPNASSTWVRVKAMVENFLTTLWRDGALQGSRPSDAFAVSVGLGTTMTAQDVLDGMLRIQVAVAMVRPAEFMVLTVELAMQAG